MEEVAGDCIYSDMNPAYFLGNLHEGAATPEGHEAPAIAASGGESQ